ncbi:ligand-binding sensor domain-containing protein [Pedobacter deserti]|uniref:ligand-binding sensor domain-containing protein n=1 Tax=Pedobacter deserti TaxID=2817382 RepID=UPI00210DC2A2|nr:sensor histidine kinase [Pedobacter sp. SYSU D00382]
MLTCSGNIIKRAFVVLCLVCLSGFGHAQYHYFERLQADEGLQHNSVTAITQDRKGFIWVGTKGGLSRFDGIAFRNFVMPDERSGANSISALHEDRSGRLWIGTLAGLFIFDPLNEKIERAAFRAITITNIQSDSADNIWMVAGGRIHSYRYRTKKDINTGVLASAFGFDERDVLWLGTAKGKLKTLRISGSKLFRTDIEAPGDPLASTPVTRILPVKEGLLIGTRRGFFRYNAKTEKIQPLLTKNPDGTHVYVRDIKVMSDGKYWLATESGIFIYDALNQTYTNIRKRAGDRYSLSDNAVYTLFQDRRKGIWAGTFFGGLNYLSKENNAFEKFFPLSSANSISGNAIREICEDQDKNIWIGTEDAGINRFDPATGEFAHISNGKLPSDLSYPNIHGLLAVDNRIYAGPFLQGLEVLDRHSGKVVERHPIVQYPENSSNAFVMSIFKTSTGRILVGTTAAGVFEYDRTKKRLRQFPHIPHKSFAFAIAEDHAGTIYTGSYANGIFYYNPRSGKRGNISFKKNSDLSPGDDIVHGIYEDSKHSLWLSTEGGGLIRLSRDRKTFRRFSTRSGFPTNNIFRVLEDGKQNLWISSLKGLICMDLNRGQFHVYGKSNGLLTDQFNYNSAYKDKAGKMYFGSVQGMIAFHPDSLKVKTAVPPLYITSIHVGEGKAADEQHDKHFQKPAIYSDTVELTYDQSTFDIAFAALDYSAAGLIRYKYKMEGLNEDWTYMNSNRKAYFTDLSPGTYKFIVQARSNIGLWETPERILTIRISPPFWKSIIAYVLYGLLVCAVIYTIVYFYHKSIENKNRRRRQLFELEKEKEVYQAKIEFFTSIAHEIQTPLTLIKGPVDWALSKIEDVPTVRRNLKRVKKHTNRLITLTSQLLDFRKTELYQFSLNFVSADINQLVLEQVNLFSSQLKERNLVVELDLPERHIKAYVDKEAFTKIISNLISNAGKYAEKHIYIRLFTPDDTTDVFKFRIENDGDVIPERFGQKIFEPFYRIKNENSIHGTGIGLSLAKYLAELHEGNLMFIVNAEINIFELALPVHQKIQFDLER